mmetsp:Transcript_70980/g.140944  ORF Transcript_70980/g.140944 Transcript_70980/m.140944 type:complete len:259 (-) Transcript_70980:2604-3380(-)
MKATTQRHTDDGLHELEAREPLTGQNVKFSLALPLNDMSCGEYAIQITQFELFPVYKLLPSITTCLAEEEPERGQRHTNSFVACLEARECDLPVGKHDLEKVSLYHVPNVAALGLAPYDLLCSALSPIYFEASLNGAVFVPHKPLEYRSLEGPFLLNFWQDLLQVHVNHLPRHYCERTWVHGVLKNTDCRILAHGCPSPCIDTHPDEIDLPNCNSPKCCANILVTLQRNSFRQLQLLAVEVTRYSEVSVDQEDHLHRL